MFLFDRRAVRFFRKDGHSWRKKADGKTVRETHEKLKVLAFRLMCWPGAWHSCSRSSNSDMALTVPGCCCRWATWTCSTATTRMATSLRTSDCRCQSASWRRTPQPSPSAVTVCAAHAHPQISRQPAVWRDANSTVSR